MPCSLSLLLLLCGLRADDACCFNDRIPSYLFFECPRGDYIDSFMTEDVSGSMGCETDADGRRQGSRLLDASKQRQSKNSSS